MTDKLTLYGHAACPDVPPIKGMLSQAKVAYDYVDIHRDAKAAAVVRSINNGNESVPTLVFPDGSTLTEPSANQLKRKLETLGYHVGLWPLIIGNGWRIVIGAVILFAVLRFLEVI